MTEKQAKKVANLEKQIVQIEEKMDKLLSLRKVLAAQIKEEKSREPKVPRVPTPEERQEQSRRDKEKNQQLLQQNKAQIQRLELH